MPKACDCSETHKTRRVVLTGGPGAGKTAVLELIRQDFCKHVKVLPESASILFGGDFRAMVRRKFGKLDNGQFFTFSVSSKALQVSRIQRSCRAIEARLMEALIGPELDQLIRSFSSPWLFRNANGHLHGAW
jgi:dephospho-CoA kinase